MNLDNIEGYSLKNLTRMNILLGKNGCGKSRLLRTVEQHLTLAGGIYGQMKYITPERGGFVSYEPNVENNILANVNWLKDMRRKNQTNDFRQQSVAQYRKLETLVLREIEKERRGDVAYTFDSVVDKINNLLDNIKIKRSSTTFEIYTKSEDNNKLTHDQISSGESELISLGIECLTFNKECFPTKENILFLDEPDVHLHPDLQVRFIHFLKDLLTGNNFRIIIATHSTAILGALESYESTNVAFMEMGQKEILFKPISSIYKKILPVFGAHPLSNLFNEAPIMLVEGEDDERIWQQAVRTSIGKCKLYPCSCEGITNINDFEQEIRHIIKSVYDNAKAYSLRDRDGGTEEIDDLPPIVKMKLSCRNAENLLLSDEVLNSLSIGWNELKNKINTWIDKNNGHVHYQVMKDFKDNNYDRKNFDIKEIRNDLMGIIGSAKPWEVVVGQIIGKLEWNDTTTFNIEGNIHNFLGEKLTKEILPKQH